MRLAVKSTVWLLVAYLLFAGGVLFWLDREWRALAHSTISRTAHLIATETARVVADRAQEQILNKDAEGYRRLAESVAQMTERSDIIGSIAVVDSTGQTIASDQPELVGKPAPLPSVVFDAGQTRPFAISDITSRERGEYSLFVPLNRDGQSVGYVRLTIESRDIAALHERTSRRFTVVAMFGLLGIIGFGLILHSQISRRSRSLARALEAAVRGEPEHGASADEFHDAVEAARRVGSQLSEERRKGFQARSRLAAIMHAPDVGVLLLDTNHALEFASTAARMFIGYHEVGELEAHWQTICPQLTAPVDDGEAEFDVELAGKGDGRRLHIEVQRLEPGGELILLIKDRRMMDALENELGLAIQMRGLVRFHRAFVHDVKTPLNAMVMNLELLKNSLQRDRDGDDVERQQKQLHYISLLKNEITRVERQAQSLLTHTAPTRETAAQDVDLRGLVNELVDLVRPMAAQQRVTLATELTQEPVFSRVNPDRFKQALLNIAINALEAMPDGGRLGVTLERVDGRVRIAIADSGPGIPAELADQIFTMHFTTKSRGSGIGLHVAKTVVDTARGEIRLEPDPNSSTCLAIYLPIVPKTTEESAAVSAVG